MKIAIIGSGISGLGAAYLLNPDHEITIFESDTRIGGHSRTIEIETIGGTTPVDTGFIVFNKHNYPNLTALFKQLNVPIVASQMSFGASIQNAFLEYGSVGLKALFAQRRNIFRPQFWGMIFDILKFNKQALNYIDSDLSLSQCLDKIGVGEWFKNYYLLAMGGAIWSMPLQEMLNFPASTFIRFFDNHGLLTINNQPQWYTVKGGSKEYVSRLSADFHHNIKLNTKIQTVERQNGQIIIHFENGQTEPFDHVIFACHPDQSLKMLNRPTEQEQKIIGAFQYQPNTVYVHTDTSFMPKHKNAWSSWIYLSQHTKDKNPSVSLSYWMNNLQPLKTSTPVIVTLNPAKIPNQADIKDIHTFEHPIFNQKAIEAQKQLGSIQGLNNTWFCGAWTRYGFHEDGLLSAINVANGLGVKPTWS